MKTAVGGLKLNLLSKFHYSIVIVVFIYNTLLLHEKVTVVRVICFYMCTMNLLTRHCCNISTVDSFIDRDHSIQIDILLPLFSRQHYFKPASVSVNKRRS